MTGNATSHEKRSMRTWQTFECVKKRMKRDPFTDAGKTNNGT